MNVFRSLQRTIGVKYRCTHSITAFGESHKSINILKMGKRILSARSSPATATSSQQFKRVNSKEELLDNDNDDVKDASPKPVLLRKISTSQEFEETLKETSTQERAMKALSVAHCSESLSCLIDLFQWEKEQEETKKNLLEAKIVNEYMKKDVAKEIFLPETLREKLFSGKVSLKEVKNHVLNDLRFNSTLLKAIGAA